MKQKGRPADKDEYLNIVLNIMTDHSHGEQSCDLLDTGFSKMTCVELALVACQLGYRPKDLPSRTKAQKDRIEIIENFVAIHVD